MSLNNESTGEEWEQLGGQVPGDSESGNCLFCVRM
jgi:hypothetical protein